MVEGIVDDLYDIYEDMKSFMSLITQMATSFNKVLNSMMQGTKTMADEIQTTAGIINGFGSQILTMAGRITATINLMAELAKDCFA
jgi:hypothetical protein